MDEEILKVRLAALNEAIEILNSSTRNYPWTERQLEKVKEDLKEVSEG